jgi:hypothetical protein
MLNWSNRVTKSITFTQEEIDRDLLAQIEVELDRHPHKTFSDLCKEALWQLLNTPTSMLDAEPGLSVATSVPTSVATGVSAPVDSPVTTPITTPVAAPVVAQVTTSVAPPVTTPIAPAGVSIELDQIAQLRRQFYDLEQRMLSSESRRFDAIEQQIQHLERRLALLETQPDSHLGSPPAPEPIPEAIESAGDDAAQPAEADPLLSRLSQYIDEF